MTDSRDLGGGASHAGELLSALVDGELTIEEEARVRAHLESCSTCSHELELLERSRALLRSLPELEPPGDFIEAIVRRRHRALVYGSVGGLAAAVVAAVLAITLDVIPTQQVEPELVALVDDHSATSVTAPASPGGSDDASFGDVRIASRVAGFELVAVSRDDDVVHALYRHRDQVVSLFRQTGDIDWDALPEEGLRTELGGREIWQASDGSSTVVDAKGAVVVIVGGDATQRSQMASEVRSEPQPSLWDRAHDAAQTALGAFVFG